MKINTEIITDNKHKKHTVERCNTLIQSQKGYIKTNPIESVLLNNFAKLTITTKSQIQNVPRN